MNPDFKETILIDQAGVEERVARLMTRSLEKETKSKALKLALNMIALTT